MKFLITRKITICMIFIALTFLGYISYMQLSMELLPTSEPPTCSIKIRGTGNYDPSYIESEVIIPLEGVVAQCNGIDEITSTATISGGEIDVEYKSGVNIKSAYIHLSELVNEYSSSNLDDEFKVTTSSSSSQNGLQGDFMTLRVTGKYNVDEILSITESDLESKLANIDGISTVTIYGGQNKSVEVELIDDLCSALNLTTQKISSTLTQAGDERTFVGFAQSGASQSSVYIDGGYSSVDMIGNVVVADGPIFLKDVAKITTSLKDPTTISRLNGERAITVSLANDSDANLIELSYRTRAEIEKLNELFSSQGITIVVADCSADEIEENIDQLVWLGIVGALLAIIILWFFLHNIRLVLAIALAIPISVYAAFNIFYAMGITINSVTLIGITLAVGMLLDNSIVVLENIYRLYTGGKSAEDAVIEGTKQVWRSIFASTLTTITVFLPFLFTSDILIALMGRNLGVAIISTLIFSLLVALLLIPMLTYLTIKGGAGAQTLFSGQISIHERPIQIYTLLLKNVMRNTKAVLGLTLALLVVSGMWALSVDNKKMSSISSDRISIFLTFNDADDIYSADEIVEKYEKALESIEELEEISCRVQEERATITLSMKEGFDEEGREISEIVEDVWKRIATLRSGLTVNINTGSSNGSSAGNQTVDMLSAFGVGDQKNILMIKGSDYDMMSDVGEDIEEILSELEYVGNVSLSVQKSSKEIKVDMNPYIVNELAMGKSELNNALSDLTDQQESGAQITLDDDEVIDIVITMASDTLSDDDELKTLDDLKLLQIESGNGGSYNLSDVSNIYTNTSKSSIKRVNRSRELKLTYSFSLNDLTTEIIDSYNAEIDALIAEYPMPGGIIIEREEEEDSFGDFKFLIFAAVLLIFMILAAVFESFTMPLILMCAVPLAAIGSFLALILTDNSMMSLNALSGFMILLGVVVNGGIILIDYINLMRSKGYSRNRAILMSGSSRLRPIMITTITTVTALLPMALGDNDYAGAIGAPFAITVIGGLSFSALLTLILVPTLYLFLEEALAWYRSLPKWIYGVHGVIMAIVIVNLWLGYSDIYTQMGQLLLAIVVIPAVTYMILHSVRVANHNIISPDDDLVIEARNLVKIYDRAGRFEREWQGAKHRRESLGIDNRYETLSDLQDLSWQGVLAGLALMAGTLYFEDGLWVTISLIAFVLLSINIWSAFYQFYLNGREGQRGSRTMRFANRIFNFAIITLALGLFSGNVGNYGVTGIYIVLLGLGYVIYSTARYIERKEINVARLTGRFAGIKAVIFNIVLAVPFIGKSRHPFEALKGVSFTIKSGMFGLLGPNGAGKSTFMRIITGLYEPSYGSIFINGLNTKTHREELQSLIGFLPQEFGMYEYMTAWDFLDYQAILKGVSDDSTRLDRVTYVLKAVHMYESKDREIGSFSGGMKQRIGIAMILLNLPRILVVDEPTAGLDPRERIRFRNLLVELSRERVVIFSTHIIEDIASSCSQVAVINRGNLKFFGQPNDMLKFAKDKVWDLTVDEEQFKELDITLVANHMKSSDGKVKVRYISPDSPMEGAQRSIESLEDAYLCMLKDL